MVLYGSDLASMSRQARLIRQFPQCQHSRPSMRWWSGAAKLRGHCCHRRVPPVDASIESMPTPRWRGRRVGWYRRPARAVLVTRMLVVGAAASRSGRNRAANDGQHVMTRRADECVCEPPECCGKKE